MRVGIIGGSIAGCATAALLHRAGHDVIVFERSESDLVSRGAGIAAPTAVWQDMMAHGLIDAALPACRADYFRFVTRGSGTGQQRWLGDVQMSFTLLNWAHLYQCFRRCVPDDLYRRASTVELVEARPQGTTLHLRPGGSLDFDLVVCADGYRSMGRRLIDPGATPVYRGMVLWRGLLHEDPGGGVASDARGGGEPPGDLAGPGTVSVKFSSANNIGTTIDVVQLSGNNTSTPIAGSAVSTSNGTTVTGGSLAPGNASDGELFYAGLSGSTTMSTPAGYAALDVPASTLHGSWFSSLASSAGVTTSLGASNAWGSIEIEINHG